MKRAIIWGKGNFYKENKERAETDYIIVGVVDQKNQIENIAELIIDKCDVVLVMVARVDYVFEIVNNLIRQGINTKKIVLGIAKWGKYSGYDSIEVCEDGGFLITKEKISINVKTPDEFYSIEETILNSCYYYELNGDVPEVVIDVGMNIGDSTLFFSRMDKVEMVYGFEPFKMTFEIAESNLRRRIDENKVMIYNYGLSNEDAERQVLCFEGMSTGLSTISDRTLKSISQREEWGVSLDYDSKRIEVVQVKDAATVVNTIVRTHGEQNRYCLKVDCEGEEYAVFESLHRRNLLDIFSYIVVEWHGNGSEVLEEYLKEAGFCYHRCVEDYAGDQGIIQAFNCRRL